jgi:phosphatidylglycerol:prolipoprotein diacylglycerol transferase
MELVIDPIVFSFGPLTVRWYGIALGLGALAGLLLIIREGKRFGIPSDFFMDLLMLGVPSAIIGARIYYVVFQWEDYKGNFLDVFKVWEGGIAIHGALIGAVIFGVIFVKYKGYNFWRIADICAPGLIIGQIIGRWGNFANQEAHGGPVAEEFLRSTLMIPDFIVNNMNINGVFYHPTFLYESLWNIVGLALLFILRRQSFIRAGEIFLTYFIWYSIGRFFIEGLRTDSLAFAGPEWLASFINALWYPMSLIFGEPGAMPENENIRAAQLIGIVIILTALIIAFIRRRMGLANERYLDPIHRTGFLTGPVS